MEGQQPAADVYPLQWRRWRRTRPYQESAGVVQETPEPGIHIPLEVGGVL